MYERKKKIELKDSNIIACKCNNEVKSLNYEVEPEDKVELIDTTTRDGRRVYIRGVTYIMAKALYELYPQALLTVNYQLSNSMLCEIENMEITEELIKRISEKMHEIVNKNIEIKKVEMTKEEAIKFYEKEKTLRGILQLDNKEKEEVSLYFCEFTDTLSAPARRVSLISSTVFIPPPTVSGTKTFFAVSRTTSSITPLPSWEAVMS